MKPIYIDLRKNQNFNLIEAVNALKQGNLVIFPTETVYGIGADGLSEKAVIKIFEAKGRKQDNPLILHVSDREMINQIACNISPVEEKLIKAFMPGPFTLILKKKECVPYCVSGGNDTVGVRMPSEKIANRLIREFGKPIAAPSANLSGKPSGTLIDDIDSDLKEKVAVILDGGQSRIGLESTVVKVVSGIPTILRPGKVTLEEIIAVCGQGEIDAHILNKMQSKDEKIESPGMKYRHYAPKTKCKVIYSADTRKMIDRIKEEIQQDIKENKKVLVLSLEEDLKEYEKEKIVGLFNMGKRACLEEVSNRIFSLLRKVDNFEADIVYLEGVSKEGVGLAIMNRLIRACEYDYIEIE